MKYTTIKYTTCFAMAALMLLSVACKKDYADPNNAAVENVVKSSIGLTGMVIGLQKNYTATRAGSIYNLITTDGFVSKQLVILNQGNTAEYQLYQGGPYVLNTNSIAISFWTNCNKVIYDANTVLAFTPQLGDKNYASGLIAYASIFKALAISNMAMFWQQIPDTSTPGVPVNFVPNTEGYTRALNVINNAIATVTVDTISGSFLSNVPAGINIVNTLHALKARFSLYTGNYAQALAEANMVDLTKRSTFNYDVVTLNPIFETATSTNNVYQPIDSTMGLPPALAPDLADKREPFYITISTGSGNRFRLSNFFATSTGSIPVYLPGEMTLIKAEAYARQNDLVNAQIELNKVITKQPAADPFGVGAGLPADLTPYTQAQLLDQIYRHRTIELYLSGLHEFDSRRFNRPNAERTRNYLPYPNVEHNGNPNTPDDPTF
ncbi:MULTISPECIES: RagB/SusD family nutrient uptake outer membrane protein [Niastella]|uniref:RagB/SusD family nutrient uptake outer membrane protein n=1 Tax=Niastella soli TaxID=2821487 RepID=A0ABS3Z0A7_9BACT|nr:RagB/SusD family nutrient uptake outer membrane protein [Niastella soli]MBO9203611.1 RagB/SusD family nutrient uptake outer membrane protein [Niastella soli]